MVAAIKAEYAQRQFTEQCNAVAKKKRFGIDVQEIVLHLEEHHVLNLQVRDA